jgi:hypothetical protein
MMAGSVMASACRAGECLRAGAGGAPGAASARGLAVATLVTWLVAESFGAIMLRSWIASGGIRDRDAMPRGLSPALIFGHAGMALTGFVSWVSFILSGSVALAWTGIGFLAVAIGLGISTVTVWTPFPVRRARDDDAPQQKSPALVTNEILDRALDDEALASRLVDDMLARMLASPAPKPPRNRRWQLAPLIPIVHGVLAIVTFLLAMLAVIAAAS